MDEKTLAVRYRHQVWTFRRLLEHSNDKPARWVVDRLKRVKRGELKMFDVLQESRLPGETTLADNKSAYVSKKGKTYTIKTIQRHLKKEYGHTITINRAWERIQKARLDPGTYESKLLLPNQQMERMTRGKKAAELPEDDLELKKREENFLALNRPEDQEMWAIQDRILRNF